VSAAAARGYELGREFAEAETRDAPRRARSEAAERGQRAADDVARDEAEAWARLDNLLVLPNEGEPGTVTLNWPGHGLPARTPAALYALGESPTVPGAREVGLAATSTAQGASTYRLHDTAAGRELGAMVRDGIDHVAELDDTGRLVARVLSGEDLRRGVREGRARPLNQPHAPVLEPRHRPADAPLPDSRGGRICGDSRSTLTDAEYDVGVEQVIRAAGPVKPRVN
jgi:hypothetical protein